MNPMQNGNERKVHRPRAVDLPRRCPSVLLAEDDDEMRKLLAGALRQTGYHVIECADGMNLLHHLRDIEQDEATVVVDLIISDIWMPGVTAVEILEGLHRRDALPPFILITAFGDSTTHARAQELGAVAMLDKPFDIGHLVERARQIAPPG